MRRGERIATVETSKFAEFAAIGATVNELLGNLFQISDRIAPMLERIDRVPPDLAATLSSIEMDTNRQEASVEEAVSLLMHMKTSMKEIDERVGELIAAAEESSSAVLEMSSSVDEVVRNAASLHQASETSAESVAHMSSSIQQVSESTESVERLAIDAASSMSEMDRALKEIGENASQAANLTAQVNEGAAKGGEAVSETISDIEKIHDRTRDAQSGLAALVSRLAEVGQIIDVIGDINDETNLVSLNAAIIAAQAGEHGRSFLVVANHVKALGKRTARSTKEITQLIGAIESNSDAAVEAMKAGVEAIEQGVSRSRIAGNSLTAIQSSAAEANARVMEIARSTEEQSSSSSVVARATRDTSDQVRQIASAIASQNEAIGAIKSNAEAAVTLCKQVHHSTDEQRATGRYIASSIDKILEMTRAIGNCTVSHDKSAREVTDTVTQMLDLAQQSGDSIPEARRIADEIGAHSAEISSEINRFAPLSD